MENSNRKRLGQFFSGDRVAKLLVSLASPNTACSVIDPMAGRGDMLAAAIAAGVSPTNVYGIEIDPSAGQTCVSRLEDSYVTVADAFLKETYAYIDRQSWDVVITNPPYVRYQAQNECEVDGIALQDAKSIRKNLINIIAGLTHLANEERKCLIKITESYSGMADLAVPSWILCASLVTPSGTLAMVVPESWLNREYALAVKYLLLKFFDIQYIVEDVSAVWFNDALVKTNLIVAKRVPCRSGLMDYQLAPYKKIRLTASVSGGHSLVDNLKHMGLKGSSALLALLSTEKDVQSVDFSIAENKAVDILHGMLNTASFEKFIKKVEGKSCVPCRPSLPKELCTVIGIDDVPACEMSSIQEWGVHIGQGLRTGANRFFYVESIRNDGETEIVKVDSLFSQQTVKLNADRVLPVFRYQSDAGNSLVIRTKDISHRLLYIQTPLTVDEVELANHINAADIIELTSAGHKTHFRDLSAVRPNIRVTNVNGRVEHRDWYMLPSLMPRHKPTMCISRVNYKRTRCLYNPERMVVDANFSTLWMEPQDLEINYAIFAIMNSNWTSAYLETISTVMGGGALKVEAAHLRQISIPSISEKRKAALARLGERLVNATENESTMIVDDIDSYLLKTITGRDTVSHVLDDLKGYHNRKTASRLR